ncbi:MAG: hypothetical protein CV090_09100, partial [Nitrospira sp. WS238]|nr:hypothetical protein [Nitrospira sp. WS238]
MSLTPVNFSIPSLCYLDFHTYRPIVDPVSHAEFLHLPDRDSDRESVFVCSKDATGHFSQQRVHLRQLSDLASSRQGEPDVYLSLNRFSRSRRVEDCVALNACFVDVDFYTVSDFANGVTVDTVLSGCVDRLYKANVPAPSLIGFTGRGLAFVWLIQTCSLFSLPIWNTVQFRLAQVLKDFGADRQALDAAHVFRLIGTVNRKSGNSVQAYGLETPERMELETLADRILQPHEGFVTRRQIRSTHRRDIGSQNRQTPAALWKRRYEDIFTLIETRYGNNCLPPGSRDRYLFILAVALAWIITPPERLDQELFQLGAALAGWDEAECYQRFSAVLGREDFIGDNPFVPQYRFKTQTIIDWLNVTPEEQQGLDVLVGAEILRERRRKRAAERRRANGQVSRDQYNQKRTSVVEWRRAHIHRLMEEENFTRDQCAEFFEISIETV